MSKLDNFGIHIRIRGGAEAEKARSISVIRREMARWGYPLDHLTDEEVEAGIIEGARLLASAGMTAEEAAVGLRAFAAASSVSERVSSADDPSVSHE